MPDRIEGPFTKAENRGNRARICLQRGRGDTIVSSADALHWKRKRISYQGKLPGLWGWGKLPRRTGSGTLAMADCINTVVKIPAPP
jgi:hypothetical protein